MAEVAGSLVSVALQRVRDPGGVAITRDFARSVVSLAQRHINALLKLVIEEATLATVPTQQLYPIFGSFPNAVKIVTVEAADGGTTHNRELDQLDDWRDLGMIDRKWFRKTGPRFEAFGTIGRGVLVIHPALAVADTVRVTYAKWTADLVAEGTATELPDEHLPLVLDLAEVILSIKMRQFEPAKMTMKRLADRLKIEIPSMPERALLKRPLSTTKVT